MDHRSVVNRVRPPHSLRAAGAASGARASQQAHSSQREPLRPIKPPPDAAEILCERAVFTSIRSPMGEGYRIVAASPGVTAQEKAAITKRAPSHGALLDEDDAAIGILAFPLAPDRYCVCASRYGGTEHTARGGRRVWTDIVILDDDQYRAFACNPLRVHGAIHAAAPCPSERMPAALEHLTIPVWDRFSEASSKLAAADIDVFGGLVAALLEGGACAVPGQTLPLETLEVAFDMLPLSGRSDLSLSAGLMFCLARRSTLVFVGDDRAAERSIVGQDIRWCDLRADVEPTASPFDDWLTFVRCRACEQRLASIARVAGGMSFDTNAAALNRVAQFLGDLDMTQWADEEEMSALRDHYSNFVAGNPFEEDLLGRLQAAFDSSPTSAESTQ